MDWGVDREAQELLFRAHKVLECVNKVKDSQEFKLVKETEELYERIHNFMRQHKISETMYWRLYNELFKLREAELELKMKLYKTNIVEGIDPIAGTATVLFGTIIDAFLGLALIGGIIHGIYYYIGWLVFSMILLAILVVMFD